MHSLGLLFMSMLLPLLEKQKLNLNTHTPPSSAAVLLAITEENKPKLLLTKRAQGLNAHAGEVSLPGGKREKSDTSNVSVALRETYEETGIHPHQVTLLGELPMQRSRSGLMVQPVVGLIAPNLTLVPEPSEIERLFWADLTTLVNQPVEPYAITYKGVKLNTPSFNIAGEVVWGLTGRILTSLLTQVYGRKLAWSYILKPSWRQIIQQHKLDTNNT